MIKEFLKSHPLISLRSIETALSIPVGTLRADKYIPEKYVGPIEDLLSDYGYITKRDNEPEKNITKRDVRKPDVPKRDTKYFTKMEKGSCVILYRDGFVKRANLPDDTKIYVE